MVSLLSPTAEAWEVPVATRPLLYSVHLCQGSSGFRPQPGQHFIGSLGTKLVAKAIRDDDAGCSTTQTKKRGEGEDGCRLHLEVQHSHGLQSLHPIVHH